MIFGQTATDLNGEGFLFALAAIFSWISHQMDVKRLGDSNLRFVLDEDIITRWKTVSGDGRQYQGMEDSIRGWKTVSGDGRQ